MILGALAFRQAFFGEGTGSILFNNVQCTGSELQLASCPLSTTPNCRHNQDAGVRCVCLEGYTSNGTDCIGNTYNLKSVIIAYIVILIDINECDSFSCNPNTTCINTPGSFTCACNQGYTGNGTTCFGNKLTNSSWNFAV